MVISVASTLLLGLMGQPFVNESVLTKTQNRYICETDLDHNGGRLVKSSGGCFWLRRVIQCNDIGEKNWQKEEVHEAIKGNVRLQNEVCGVQR